MLTAFKVNNNILSVESPTAGSDWLSDVVWIDLVNPTKEEIQVVEKYSGISLPKIQETEEIEASSHYEIYPEGFQINCLFLQKVEEHFSNINVAFLCNNKCLISLCALEVLAINLLQKQWQKSPRSKSDPISIERLVVTFSE